MRGNGESSILIKSKKSPFQNTTVDPYKTKEQIDKLLNEFGVTKTAWQIDLDQNLIELNFEAEAEINGQRRVFFFQIKPSLFESSHRSYNPKTGRSEKIIAPNMAASMRWLYNYVKAKLEAVAYGMITVEKEFLAQVIVSDQHGKPTTIGDALTPILESGKFPALTDQSNEANVIDAEYREA